MVYAPLAQGGLSNRISSDARRTTRVLVVGELNVDIVAAGLLRPPRLGYEIEATSFDVVLGSASAIFACGVARLGNAVSFVAKVGRDAFGARCVRELRRRGIDTSAVMVDDRLRTGATLVMSTKRDRAMVTYAGAMAELREREVPRSAFASAAHLHLTSYDLQRALRPGFAKLLERAKRAGMTTSLDPNSSLTGRSRHDFMALLPWVDILLLNALEARQLTGQSSPRSALERLARRAPMVVVKLGARGALLAHLRRVHAARPIEVNAVDTTGAGDSFAAGFVSAFLHGLEPSLCLESGNVCGALSTRALGGTAAQAGARELARYLAAEKRRNIAAQSSQARSA
jgi:sugar/nucleoside kinase (ribokinase family)